MKKILVMVSVAAIAAALVSSCGKKEETPASKLDSLKESAARAATDAEKKVDAAAQDAQKKVDEVSK